MRRFSGPAAIIALLSFNGGFVDTATFLGLQGLFVSHVTGNFVTLGAALVLGSHGVIGKLLALPEFILIVALARLAGAGLRKQALPALRILLAAEAVLLFAFFILAVVFGPFPDPDSAIALIAGFIGVAAMALQNALQRVHFAHEPPTTIMTGNTTQAAIDAVDLLIAPDPANVPRTRARFVRVVSGILYFALGCAASAALFWLAGFWCLAVAVVVGVAAAVMQLEPASV